MNIIYILHIKIKFYLKLFIIDLTKKDLQEKYMQPSSKLLVNTQALTSNKCDILGNDVTTIDYIFAVLILFCILIFCIAIIYIYVYFKVKKSKEYVYFIFDINQYN